MMHDRVVSPAKLEEVQRLVSLVSSHNVVGLARIEKVPAKALHNLRDTLRKDVVITVSKKKLIRRAFETSGKDALTDLSDQITGITALLFTDMNPIKLAQYLESKAVKGPAKPGDIAPSDIVVKEGDTKLAPGPIISELNQNLKVQTLIKNGTIHVRTDTVTHHAGDFIDAKQAQLLSRLGVEPMTIKLDFYAAWENGEIIPAEVLHLDEGKILDDTRLAASQALNLALALGMITEETVVPMVQKAAMGALAVAMELPILLPELIDKYFARAIQQATYVNATALGLEMPGASATPAPAAEPEKPKKEEPKVEEPTGLGSLFG